jgi:hypothetical protein
MTLSLLCVPISNSSIQRQATVCSVERIGLPPSCDKLGFGHGTREEARGIEDEHQFGTDMKEGCRQRIIVGQSG